MYLTAHEFTYMIYMHTIHRHKYTSKSHTSPKKRRLQKENIVVNGKNAINCLLLRAVKAQYLFLEEVSKKKKVVVTTN